MTNPAFPFPLDKPHRPADVGRCSHPAPVTLDANREIEHCPSCRATWEWDKEQGFDPDNLDDYAQLSWDDQPDTPIINRDPGDECEA